MRAYRRPLDRRPRPDRHLALAPGALAACLALGAAQPPVLAQPAPAVAAIRIAAQPLSQALAELARQTGTTLVAAPALLADKTAPAVAGPFTAQQALLRLLAGSGLVGSLESGVITVQRAGDAGAGDLREVTVTAEAERSRATTENTDSYTAQAVAAGSKLEQRLKDIPRSISLMARQQLDDQRITRLDEALEQLPGVTFSPNAGGWGSDSYYLRGYSLTNLTIDGSSTKNFFNGSGDSSFSTGLEKYDSVQLLRGPDALFSGNGAPSGSINLVRKRPTDRYQLKTTVSAGSWNNYLGTVDVSGPLNQAGSLRGRAVASYNDTEKFYDNAPRKYTTLYGILEADLSRDTLLTTGISYDKAGGTGWDTAPSFPRYSNGDPLRISRSTGYTADAKRNSESINVFASLEQRFNSAWKGRLNASYTRSNGYTAADFYYGAADPLTSSGTYYFSPRANTWKSEAVALDFNIRGDTTLWGHEYRAVFGADYVNTDADYYQRYTTANYPGGLSTIHWSTFDPSLLTLTTGSVAESLTDTSRQYGIYAYNSLQVYGPLRFVLGGRWSGYEKVNINKSTAEQTYLSHPGRSYSRLWNRCG
ncbi:TonB-dependent siderophore receptor [Xylophilus sp.]|uniref:TonB-dependent siderophore receptor n=1 Tax=Xylophilus sp. TaxID=2653893 RepID=UPI0013B78506|nr:TonB-dependent receptor [Xylophilus sp.]KAF1043664.1 MAG: Ferripyoverdine receptor [Xylophilus sp.]